MLKVLKFIGKASKEIFQIIYFFLAITMVYFLARSVLLEAEEGKFSVYVACNKTCYDELGLADTVPFDDELIVEIERPYLACQYLTYLGPVARNYWKDDWTLIKIVEEKFDTLDLLLHPSWPLEPDQFDRFDGIIRKPEFYDYRGCFAQYPEYDLLNFDS